MHQVQKKCCYLLYLRIVVYCSHSERISDQSLQFPNPTHHNFNFISDFGRFGRVFCLFFMARIESPLKRSAMVTCFRIKLPPTRSLFYSVRQQHHACRVDAKEDVKDFRPLCPSLAPSKIVVLFLYPERAFHRGRPKNSLL